MGVFLHSENMHRNVPMTREGATHQQIPSLFCLSEQRNQRFC